jgi:hypothetical protein
VADASGALLFGGRVASGALTDMTTLAPDGGTVHAGPWGRGVHGVLTLKGGLGGRGRGSGEVEVTLDGARTRVHGVLPWLAPPRRDVDPVSRTGRVPLSTGAAPYLAYRCVGRVSVRRSLSGTATLPSRASCEARVQPLRDHPDCVRVTVHAPYVVVNRTDLHLWVRPTARMWLPRRPSEDGAAGERAENDDGGGGGGGRSGGLPVPPVQEGTGHPSFTYLWLEHQGLQGARADVRTRDTRWSEVRAPSHGAWRAVHG